MSGVYKMEHFFLHLCSSNSEKENKAHLPGLLISVWRGGCLLMDSPKLPGCYATSLFLCSALKTSWDSEFSNGSKSQVKTGLCFLLLFHQPWSVPTGPRVLHVIRNCAKGAQRQRLHLWVWILLPALLSCVTQFLSTCLYLSSSVN